MGRKKRCRREAIGRREGGEGRGNTLVSRQWDSIISGQAASINIVRS